MYVISMPKEYSLTLDANMNKIIIIIIIVQNKCTHEI